MSSITIIADSPDGIELLPTSLNPVVKNIIEYNVIVYKEERAICGGTVIASNTARTIVLTAAHCVLDENTKKPMKYGYVGFNGDDKYRCEVVELLREQDLALLEVTDPIKSKRVAPIAGSSPVNGDMIWVIGFGAGIEDIISHGIVAKAEVYSKHTKYTHCVLIDASAYYGNSGGGVFNVNGALVGVFLQNGPQHPADGLWNYAVHYKEMIRFIQGYLK